MVLGAEAVDACEDDTFDRRRNLDRNGVIEVPRAVLSDESTEVDE